jgi:hypothetical protein
VLHVCRARRLLRSRRIVTTREVYEEGHCLCSTRRRWRRSGAAKWEEAKWEEAGSHTSPQPLLYACRALPAMEPTQGRDGGWLRYRGLPARRGSRTPPANAACKCHLKCRLQTCHLQTPPVHLQSPPANVACKRHLQTPPANAACKRHLQMPTCKRRTCHLQTPPANAAYLRHVKTSHFANATWRRGWRRRRRRGWRR